MSRLGVVPLARPVERDAADLEQFLKARVTEDGRHQLKRLATGTPPFIRGFRSSQERGRHLGRALAHPPAEHGLHARSVQVRKHEDLENPGQARHAIFVAVPLEGGNAPAAPGHLPTHGHAFFELGRGGEEVIKDRLEYSAVRLRLEPPEQTRYGIRLTVSRPGHFLLLGPGRARRPELSRVGKHVGRRYGARPSPDGGRGNLRTVGRLAGVRIAGGIRNREPVGSVRGLGRLPVVGSILRLGDLPVVGPFPALSNILALRFLVRRHRRERRRRAGHRRRRPLGPEHVEDALKPRFWLSAAALDDKPRQLVAVRLPVLGNQQFGQLSRVGTHGGRRAGVPGPDPDLLARVDRRPGRGLREAEDDIGQR